jgi:ABC-type glycerol-3-phosphate transport system substrate-binding protein
MKRTFCIFTLLAFLFTACTPSASVTTVTPAFTGTPKPAPTLTPTPAGIQIQVDNLRGLTLRVAHPWFGTDASLFESMVAEFNNSNPWGIDVVATGNVNYSLLYENVTAALPTSETPHVAVALPEHARLWDAERFVADLTPYVTDPNHGWSADEVADIPAVFWAQDADGDRRLALPFQRSARFLLWNQTWAAELGFASPPASPDDFRQQACRAQQSMTTDSLPENDGLGGWVVDTDAMTALAWMQVFGGGVLEGNDYRFMTKNNIDAFTFARKLQEDGCAWMPSSDIDPLASFAARNALFITVDLEQFPSVTRAFGAAGNTDTWRPLAFPGDVPALPVYGASLVMFRSNEEEQLASWLFMNWLVSAENDARTAKTTGLFPLRTSTLGMLADYKASHPQWAQAVDLLPEGGLQPQLGSWRLVRVMLGDGFTHMFRVSLPSGQVATILSQMEATSRELSK